MYFACKILILMLVINLTKATKTNHRKVKRYDGDLSLHTMATISPTTTPTFNLSDEITISTTIMHTFDNTSLSDFANNLTQENRSDEKKAQIPIKVENHKVNSTKDALHKQNGAKITNEDKVVKNEEEKSIELQVKVLGNTTVQLPQNVAQLEAVVSLNNSTLKKEYLDDLSYEWVLVSQPKNSKAQMEKKDNKIESSQLIAGLYQFEVKVTNQKRLKGESSVNVTVLKVPRINTPPVANVDPIRQIITLPTNQAIIDASGSTDDDGIESFDWELVTGPLQDSSYNNAGHDKILRLKNLTVGNYTYKLTITDTDGVTDSEIAYIRVDEKIDHQPVAIIVASDQAITLPVDSIYLFANQSTDDWGIASYQWSIAAESKMTVADLVGSMTKVLHVTQMQEGDYTFQLVVTDTSGQKATAKINIIVQPKSNEPPVANAGADSEILLPLEGPASVVLNGNLSRDDELVTSYSWVQVGEVPSKVKILHSTSMITEVEGLQEPGKYQFKLTVADAHGKQDEDTVEITLNPERAPVARAGDDITIQLPDNSVVLDGYKSSDDYGIVKFNWIMQNSCPPFWRIVNNSDETSRLLLTNLQAGTYKLTLQVTNKRNRIATDNVTVHVEADVNIPYYVELHLPRGAIQSKTEFNDFVKLLELSLSKFNGEIVIVEKYDDHKYDTMVLVFYMKSKEFSVKPINNIQASLIVDEIGSNLETTSTLLGVEVKAVETYECRNTCSGRGRCHYKYCECDTFWMENFLRVYAGDGVRNCDWSVLYVIIISFILSLMLLMFLSCFTFYICKKKEKIMDAVKKRKNKKYFKLNGKMHGRKNGLRGSQTSSLMRSMTSSSESSCEDNDEIQLMTSSLQEKRKFMHGSVTNANNRRKRKKLAGKRVKNGFKSSIAEEETTLVAIDNNEVLSDGSAFDGYGLDHKADENINFVQGV